MHARHAERDDQNRSEWTIPVRADALIRPITLKVAHEQRRVNYYASLVEQAEDDLKRIPRTYTEALRHEARPARSEDRYATTMSATTMPYGNDNETPEWRAKVDEREQDVVKQRHHQSALDEAQHWLTFMRMGLTKIDDPTYYPHFYATTADITYFGLVAAEDGTITSIYEHKGLDEGAEGAEIAEKDNAHADE